MVADRHDDQRWRERLARFQRSWQLIGLRVAGRTDAVGIYYIVPINLAANLLRLVPNKFAAGPETTRPPKETQFSLFVPQSVVDKAPAAYAARLGFKTAKAFRVLIDKVRFTEVSYATVMLDGGVRVSPLTLGIHEISVMAIGEYGSSQVLNCSFSVAGLPRALHLEGEQSGDFSRVPQCEIRDERER